MDLELLLWNSNYYFGLEVTISEPSGIIKMCDSITFYHFRNLDVNLKNIQKKNKNKVIKN
jgi:hypothetical protein